MKAAVATVGGALIRNVGSHHGGLMN